MALFLTGIFVIFLGGVLSLIVPERLAAKIFALFVLISGLFFLFPAGAVLLSGKALTFYLYFAYPVGTVRFLLDPLAAFFVVLITVMGMLGVIYAAGHISFYTNKKLPVGTHFFFLGLLLISMILVCVIQNAIAFLVIWELMAISSFFLIILEHTKKAVLNAGIYYLINMHVGFFILLIAFLFLSIKSGSVDFASFAVILGGKNMLASLMLLLLMMGFGVKAGFFPLHTWLPRAHPAAPSHISGLMSGVMIKTGIYGILRFVLLTGTPSLLVCYGFLMVSAITAVYGILYAVAQRDIKKLLAFSSIENIGIIGIGLSVGMLGLAYNNQLMIFFGFAGGLLHGLNHAVFKQLLFYAVGTVYQITHTRDIELMGGLVKKMPLLSVLFLTGALAITGLPVFNGFVSEFFIYSGLFHAFSLHNPRVLLVFAIIISLLAFIGAVALLCFSKVFSVMFLGSPRSELSFHPLENSYLQWVPMWILGLLAVGIGVFPQYAIGLVGAPTRSFISLKTYLRPDLGFFNSLSFSLGIFLVIICAVFFLRRRLGSKVVYRKTWACAYPDVNPRMQYTSLSFSDPFLSLMKPFISLKVLVSPLETLFPKGASFKSSVQYRLEKYLILPAYRLITRWFGALSWMQSGYTQSYVLYGVVFLILAIVWVILTS